MKKWRAKKKDINLRDWVFKRSIIVLSFLLLTFSVSAAINDISLTSGMRNNLLALQGTPTSLNTKQDRLSSGKKVNTALDNPTNYFAAQSAINRASDLGARKDSMTEAIQTIKTADAGFTGITGLVQAAKGLAEAALSTSSPSDRDALNAQAVALLAQVDKLAKDSGYSDSNFLSAGNNYVFSAVEDTFNASSSGQNLGTSFNQSNGNAAASSAQGSTQLTNLSGISGAVALSNGVSTTTIVAQPDPPNILCNGGQ